MLSSLIEAGPRVAALSLPRARHGLHVMPTGCGYERRIGPDYDWQGLKRGTTPFTILQFTLSGMGHLRFGGRELMVPPGEAMVLSVPHDHRYWLDAGGEWEFFWLSMTGTEAVRIHGLIQRAGGPLVRLKRETVDLLAGLCLRLMAGAVNMPGAASALGYQALMALVDDVLGGGDADPALDPAIRRVIDYLADNPALPVNVDRMAGVAGLSRAHFSRRFASETGVPPAEYALDGKMRQAARLLASAPDMPVKTVAARTGFSDPNYFSKVFRRIHGLSPGDFRASGMFYDRARPPP
jgi:AraC-like DNA-binding protein